MNEREVLQIFNEVGMIQEGHFVSTFGHHFDTYVNKDALYPYTRETSRLCSAIAENFWGTDIEVVIAPAVGGCILSTRVAEHLTRQTGEEVLSIYADKDNDGFVIKRGYDKLVVGKNVLVVEDVLTTGGSARKVVEAVRALGGNVVGVGALCNRGGVTAQDLADVPKLDALMNTSLHSWGEADCPLCARGVPINTDVGKGREFLARQKNS